MEPTTLQIKRAGLLKSVARTLSLDYNDPRAQVDCLNYILDWAIENGLGAQPTSPFSVLNTQPIPRGKPKLDYAGPAIEVEPNE